MINFTKINHDINGNPRYVCHFLNLLTKEEKQTGKDKYEIALKRAKRIGGKKYHTKTYGGGIVFQSFNIQMLENSINGIINE